MIRKAFNQWRWGGPPVLTFGIPLKASSDPVEWRELCRLLSATVASIYNQTDPAFRIIVACDRPPELDVATDRRLEFLPIGSQPTLTDSERDNDAGYKRWEIACRFARGGGGYLMLLDADDLVSNRLVSFVRETRHPNGYLFETGYGMSLASGRFLPIPQPGVTDAVFHQMCGSSAIVRIAPEDVVPDNEGRTRFGELYKLGHPSVATASEEQGRSLMTMPFRAAVYVVAVGVSTSRARANRDRTFAVERATWERVLDTRGFRNAETDAEFGLSYDRARRHRFTEGWLRLARRMAMASRKPLMR